MSSTARIFDVVIVGSGAGAMTASLRAHDLGLSVVVLEKMPVYGGTSAISGGGIWIPNNTGMAEAGIKDSFEQALTYVKAATKGEVPEEKLAAYLTSALEMLRYLEEKAGVRYRSVTRYPDYYPDLPGYCSGGRTMEPEFFRASRLGEEFKNLHSPTSGTLVFGRFSMSQKEGGIMFSRSPGWQWTIAKVMLRYWLDIPARLRGKRDGLLSLGNAMVAALRRAMLDRGIPLWLETPFDSLIWENGRVSGVEARQNGQAIRIDARLGVILAAGGFEGSQELREQFLPKPTQAAWSQGMPQNKGEGILAGIELGAATEFTDVAWWAPTIKVPGHDRQWGVLVERSLPGCVIVNKLGKRFANEAEPYLEFGNHMYEDNARTNGANVPCYVVFDATFRHKYMFGPMMPGQVRPDSSLPANWEGLVYWKADTLDGLAQRVGLNADGLKTTIANYNDYARNGKDLEFDKGGNVYDRYYGDRSVTPNPCLAPVAKPPFYAMRLDAGDIGTKGGLKTDKDARVMRADGTVIPGLQAIGNSSGSVMGHAYPGPGCTIGPAMVFGFRAANHLATDARRNVSAASERVTTAAE